MLPLHFLCFIYLFVLSTTLNIDLSLWAGLHNSFLLLAGQLMSESFVKIRWYFFSQFLKNFKIAAGDY